MKEAVAAAKDKILTVLDTKVCIVNFLAAQIFPKMLK